MKDKVRWNKRRDEIRSDEIDKACGFNGVAVSPIKP
jgi:hypothetical protein